MLPPQHLHFPPLDLSVQLSPSLPSLHLFLHLSHVSPCLPSCVSVSLFVFVSVPGWSLPCFCLSICQKLSWHFSFLGTHQRCSPFFDPGPRGPSIRVQFSPTSLQLCGSPTMPRICDLRVSRRREGPPDGRECRTLGSRAAPPSPPRRPSQFLLLFLRLGWEGACRGGELGWPRFPALGLERGDERGWGQAGYTVGDRSEWGEGTQDWLGSVCQCVLAGEPGSGNRNQGGKRKLGERDRERQRQGEREMQIS